MFLIQTHVSLLAKSRSRLVGGKMLMEEGAGEGEEGAGEGGRRGEVRGRGGGSSPSEEEVEDR